MTSSCTDDIRDDNKAAQMTGSPDPYMTRAPIPPEPILRERVKKGPENRIYLVSG